MEGGRIDFVGVTSPYALGFGDGLLSFEGLSLKSREPCSVGMLLADNDERGLDGSRIADAGCERKSFPLGWRDDDLDGDRE